MYEFKYERYLPCSQSRFAEADEVMRSAAPFISDGRAAASGIPLFYDDDTIYLDDCEMHSMIVGPTGCGKTRAIVLPTVISMIRSGQSAVINDPKGELYARTSAEARDAGADVYVLNFRDTEHSDFWNPLEAARRLFAEGRQTEAIALVNDFAESVFSASEARTVDRYWTDTGKALLNSLCLLLIASVPAEYANITNLIPLSYEENAELLESLLRDMKQTSACAFGLHTTLDLVAERTKSCIYGMLQAVLSPFVQNAGLQHMLSDSSFRFEDIGRRQTIIYLIYPDEKSGLNFLINAFLSQCYESLVAFANTFPDKKLPERVNFVIDEFSNLPCIANFDNRISEARSRNIRYQLIVQSYDQLENKYGQTANTILSNCGNWVCFATRETDFIAKLSAICGRETDSSGVEHDLITAFDMQHLRKGWRDAKGRVTTEALLIRQGLFPYVMDLRDIDSIPAFSAYRYSDPSSVISGESRAVYINANELFSGIQSGKFSFPFPSDECADETDGKRVSRKEDLAAELERKFDELFGKLDDDDDDDDDDDE